MMPIGSSDDSLDDVERPERPEKAHQLDVFDGFKTPRVSDETGEAESDESKPDDQNSTHCDGNGHDISINSDDDDDDDNDDDDDDDNDDDDDDDNDDDHHNDENQKKRRRIREFISDIDQRVEGTYDTMETLRDSINRLIHSGDCGPIEDGFIYEHDPETWQLFRDVNDAWSLFQTALDTLDSRYHALHDGWWHNRRYEKNKELNAIHEENPANVNKHQI